MTLTILLAALAVGRVETAMKPFVERGILPGAISVLQASNRVETACLGYADVRTKRPITLDDPFQQCSQTKAFCGVTVALLAEEGKISLDDPVSKYLPEFKSVWVLESETNGVRRCVAATNAITVRMCLNHTAGFAFELPVHQLTGWSHRMPLRSVACEAAQLPLVFEPGTMAKYSNVGIDVGAAVVEVISGEPWEKFLKRRVLDPLGMSSTCVRPTDAQLKRRIEMTVTHANAPATPRAYHPAMRPPFNGETTFPSAGAGLWTTARDQLKFYRMLMNLGVGENGVRILKEETVRAILVKSTRPVGLGGYSLGLYAPVSDNPNEWVGHGGAWFSRCYFNWQKRQLKFWVVQLEGEQPWKPALEAAEKSFFDAPSGTSAADAYTGRLEDSSSGCRYEIVLPSGIEPCVQTAVRELQVGLDALVEQGRVTIGGMDGVRFHVGETEFAMRHSLDNHHARGEGWFVKSVGRDVVLGGAGAHGCLYAVYHFLEDICGMKWRTDGTPDAVRQPVLNLPELDLAGQPAFLRRDIDMGVRTDVAKAFRQRLNLNYNLGIGQEFGGGALWRAIREPAEEAIRATWIEYRGQWQCGPEIWQVDGITGDAATRLKAIEAIARRVEKSGFGRLVFAVRIDGRYLPPPGAKIPDNIAVELVEPTLAVVKAWRKFTWRICVRDHADGKTPPDATRYRELHKLGIYGCVIEHDPKTLPNDELYRLEAAILENPDAVRQEKAPEAIWRKTICTEPGRMVAGPSAAVATNGDVIVVFSGNRDSMDCPWGRTEMIRSTDGGWSWSRPQVIHPGVLDNRDHHLKVESDGTLTVDWFASDAFRDGCEGYRRHYVKLGEERVSRSRGRWRQVSTDNGKTWSKPVRVSAEGKCPSVGADSASVKLADGTVLRIWHEAPGPHDPTVLMAQKVGERE